MLLFLQDPGPSLEAVFEILCNFACFSGLQVNWEKSCVMAIDTGVQALASKIVPLSWVSEFKYLGVRISLRAGDFIIHNLLPLLTKVKIQLDAWRHLPLSLIGRVNLPKMKILPVFLYFLQIYPVWVPCSFFRRVNSLAPSCGLDHIPGLVSAPCRNLWHRVDWHYRTFSNIL